MPRIAYSIKEACLMTGLGSTKLYELIKEGKLKARKIGKRTLILHDDLEAFMSNLTLFNDEDQRDGLSKSYSTTARRGSS